ncbi:hypothetical protein BCIN_07g06590 [Botrytis cinerea B05.10]|uniref:Nuclease s1 protein n=1 Tax=Botryotinia fuckeliana (strain B05.10) TaxID=332648 RepID=A0A384JNP8_BOTFB|nr:hypothetical protein BCIN_07g06590 [Botrytis cinerea B05.10]ATZ52163.1 hypothetical protein BCIN_07g06590 [Botrytis cinerea B05.10]
MKVQTSAALLLSSWVPATYAWGTLGHYTVGYVATNFVSTATKTYFQDILGDTSADYLASVAAWADSYRYTTAGTFTAPFHYIDAQDNPPSSCGVSYSRDCGSTGCIISAINNYTTILQKGTASAANLDIAAKMIIHVCSEFLSQFWISSCLHSPYSTCHYQGAWASRIKKIIRTTFVPSWANRQYIHKHPLLIHPSSLATSTNLSTMRTSM